MYFKQRRLNIRSWSLVWRVEGEKGNAEITQGPNKLGKRRGRGGLPNLGAQRRVLYGTRAQNSQGCPYLASDGWAGPWGSPWFICRPLRRECLPAFTSISERLWGGWFCVSWKRLGALVSHPCWGRPLQLGPAYSTSRNRKQISPPRPLRVPVVAPTDLTTQHGWVWELCSPDATIYLYLWFWLEYFSFPGLQPHQLRKMIAQLTKHDSKVYFIY